MDPMTMAMMGAAAGNALSGIGGMIGSSSRAAAAGQASQQNALLQTIAMQQAQERFNQAKATLMPFANAGASSIDMLMKYLTGTGAADAKVGGGGGNLMSTFAPTMEQLEATPGYQFARNQGLGAMTNAAAAKGLGMSGNLVRGLGEYATGFASQTFNDQLNNYLKQNQSAYNMLSGMGNMGVNAGNAIMAGTGNFNGQMLAGAQGVGNILTQGTMGAANANAQGTNALFGGAGAAIGNVSSIPMANAQFNAYMNQSQNFSGLPAGIRYSQSEYPMSSQYQV